MNAIYIKMAQSREVVSLPTTLDVENKSVALFEITGKVSEYTSKALFMCVDFVESSILSTGKQLPIVRRIKISKAGKGQGGRLDQTFDKMLWLPTNRSPIGEFSVYICDDSGNLAPFESCNLNCTLVCIPKLV